MRQTERKSMFECLCAHVYAVGTFLILKRKRVKNDVQGGHKICLDSSISLHSDVSLCNLHTHHTPSHPAVKHTSAQPATEWIINQKKEFNKYIHSFCSEMSFSQNMNNSDEKKKLAFWLRADKRNACDYLFICLFISPCFPQEHLFLFIYLFVCLFFILSTQRWLSLCPCLPPFFSVQCVFINTPPDSKTCSTERGGRAVCFSF